MVNKIDNYKDVSRIIIRDVMGEILNISRHSNVVKNKSLVSKGDIEGIKKFISSTSLENILEFYRDVNGALLKICLEFRNSFIKEERDLANKLIPLLLNCEDSVINGDLKFDIYFVEDTNYSEAHLLMNYRDEYIDWNREWLIKMVVAMF